MVRAVKDEIVKLPADGKKDLYEALVEFGGDLKAYARVISMIAIHGIRPFVQGDAEQLELDQPSRFMPKVIDIEGEKVVRVDATTQMQALKLYAEILGLKETGVKVNVNTGNQVNVRDAKSLGDHFLAAKSGEVADVRLRAAVQALDPEQRRALAAAMKDDMREVIDVTASSSTGEA